MSWNNGLFGCCSPFGTCCYGCWCPCLLYGKTKARKSAPSDPDPSGCNGSCFGWCALSFCGLSAILQCLDRGDTRERYGIEGNACTDCLASWCCACCGLIQSEKEVKGREEMARTGATPAGYQKVDNIAYQSGGQNVNTMAYQPGGPGGPVV